MSLLTIKLAHLSENMRQQQQNLPQQFTHNMIIHMHWCYRHQGEILPINTIQQDALAIRLSRHLDEVIDR